MTLYRQVFLLLTLIMLVSLAAVMSLNLRSNASYLEQQLYSSTDSAVTSLGMRLTPLLQPLDRVSAESTVYAAFDGTLLQRIDLELFADGSHIVRSRQTIDDGVPQWFIRWFEIEPVITRAPLTSGWTEVGLLTVEGHPGSVYKQLWSLALRLLAVYGLLFGVLALFSAVALRWLIRPLRQIEHQAHAIEQKDFDYRIPLPRTRELRRVVEVLNHLTALLKARFLDSARQLQEMRGKLLLDAESGVMTRQALLDALLLRQQEDHAGILVMLRLGNLDTVRKQGGYQQWRSLLSQATSLIEKHFAHTDGDSSLLLGRLSSEELGLLLASNELAYPEQQLQAMCDELNQLTFDNAPDQRLDCYAAGLAFADQPVAKLLTRLDEQIRGTAGTATRAFWLSNEMVGQHARTAEQWLALLRSKLATRAIELRWQPVLDRQGQVVQAEVFSGVLDERGGLLHAGLFVPVIEQFELGGLLDQAVVEAVIAAHKPVPSAVNLSLSAMRDTRFIGALSAFSTSDRSRLLFELSELNLQRDYETVFSFATVLRQLGFSFGIDQLGASGLSLDYLQRWRPAYVKLAPNLCRDDFAHGELLSGVINTASSLGIPIYATAVETVQQAERLWQSDISGVQGYLTDN